ncbi:hypothetical protein [Sorangium sp. So ce1000]|uniref:sialidase family protein n=1 Tax=Sorangium sp. So ce1000 TaxID=3133325 RepID=UPI003F61542D
MRSFFYHAGALLAALLSARCHGTSDSSARSTSGSTTGTSDPPDAGDPPDADDAGDGDAGDGVVPMKTWTVEKTPTDVPIWYLWGSGPNDVYAVGENGTILHSKGDGNWVKEPIASTAPIAYVGGSGPDDVYVANVFSCGPGGCEADGGGVIEGGFYHSKGDGVWTRILPEYPDGLAVWMIEKDNGYVMGSSFQGDVLLHMKGPDNWALEKLPIDNVGPHGMWSSSPTDIYVLGQGNRVFHSKGDGNWTAQDHPWDDVFYRIWGSGPKDVYITARNFRILHSRGDGVWDSQTIPPIRNSPIAVWGSGPEDVYVVTGELLSTTGEILHANGDGEWKLVEGSFPSLYAVWGSGPDDVYVAGDHGAILHLK